MVFSPSLHSNYNLPQLSSEMLSASSQIALLCALLAATGVKGSRDSFEASARAALLKRHAGATGTARNVVLVVGDGMSLATVAAARVAKGQREGRSGVGEEMLFESFPVVGLARTWAVDKYVADSASTATALLCGVKTRYEAVGVDDSVVVDDCGSVDDAALPCMAEWAMAGGKWVGLVTNMRVTHATPAPLYAHSAQRWWEGDHKMTQNASRCKDIARQLVEDYPGRNLRVVVGGGREVFMPNTTFDPEYPEKRGKRADDRHLVDAWLKLRRDNNQRHRYVWNKKDFDDVDPEKTDFLLGLFEPSHMLDVTERDETEWAEPSLADMAEKAIRILSRNEKGFFLLVEGGLIDKRHHEGKAVRAVKEALALEEAVAALHRLTTREDTLLVVTSDHSQALNFVGYANVGEDIFGIAGTSNVDQLPYTTLMYSSGPGYDVAKKGRANVTGVDTAHRDYRPQATVPRSSSSHGGEDVAVYAEGPGAALLAGAYDQHLVAHALAAAACLRPHPCPLADNAATRRGSGVTTVVAVLTATLTWKMSRI